MKTWITCCLLQDGAGLNGKDMLHNNKPMFTYVPEYNGHIITGKVTNRLTGTPQPDVVKLIFPFPA